MANIYGIDLGTCNLKIFSKHSNKIIKEKNTIAIINKNQLYAYGNEAYAMYEKAPENTVKPVKYLSPTSTAWNTFLKPWSFKNLKWKI